MRPLRGPALVGEQAGAEQHARRASLEPIAAMRPFEVVEAEVVLQVALHGLEAPVVGAPERAAPQLGEDRALEPLDEAVGPRMPRPSAAMLDPEPRAGLPED